MYNGSTIQGEAVMLSKYGGVYNVLDNKYHPNPGPRSEGYPEIERCIDWAVDNNLPLTVPISGWMKTRIANYLDFNGITQFDEIDFDDLIGEVMFNDAYEISPKTEQLIKECTESLIERPESIKDFLNQNEVEYADNVVEYINEKFLRVRAGGKLNPEGTDSIYFRISSHGYDWHRTIVEFLWDTFGSISKMPRLIWIGTDLENRGEEIVMFEGTPEELFDNDSKRFESIFKEVKSKTEYHQKDRVFRNRCLSESLSYKVFA